MAPENTLHIYAQEIWHGEAYIVGTESALIDLANKISEACTRKHTISEHSVNDGEGYNVHILVVEDMDPLSLPYTDDVAKIDSRQIADVVHPWDFVAKETT